mmetsp:Transcript_10675/g.26982  ORF Transcript_10675/g.26982 Transcript_10675/m.26982 type:complete len:154 (+) Transcript_10675:67-528(+)
MTFLSKNIALVTIMAVISRLADRGGESVAEWLRNDAGEAVIKANLTGLFNDTMSKALAMPQEGSQYNYTGGGSHQSAAHLVLTNLALLAIGPAMKWFKALGKSILRDHKEYAECIAADLFVSDKRDTGHDVSVDAVPFYSIQESVRYLAKSPA